MLTFELLKYSTTPDAPQGVRNFKWSHIQNGLVVVFDSFRRGGGASENPMQLLKIIQGTRILEETPLQELVESGKALLQTMLAHSASVTADQLPISALVKSPLVGIRYNLPNGMARRFQLKFASSKDYDVALDYLLRQGLHISQSNHAQSTVNHVTRPATSGVHEQPTSQLKLVSRPSTAITNGQLNLRPVSSSPNQDSTATVDRPFTLETTVPSFESTSSVILPFEQSFSQRTLTLPSRFTTQEEQAGRPGSGYSDLVNRERHPLPASRITSSDPLNPPEWFERPSTSSSMTIIPEYAADTSSSNTPLEHTFGKKIELPPRRELPFARPGTARPPSRDPLPSTQRPGTAMAAPTLLSTSKYNNATSKTGSVTDPMALDPLPEPTFIDKVANPVRASAPSSDRRIAQPRRPLSSRGSSQTVPQEDIIRRSPRLQQPHSPVHTDSAEDRVLAELSSNAPGSQNGGLNAYAMHSGEERKNILNEFMLQHIDDENFVTLCEDMSACWAAIGLGLM